VELIRGPARFCSDVRCIRFYSTLLRFQQTPHHNLWCCCGTGCGVPCGCGVVVGRRLSQSLIGHHVVYFIFQFPLLGRLSPPIFDFDFMAARRISWSSGTKSLHGSSTHFPPILNLMRCCNLMRYWRYLLRNFAYSIIHLLLLYQLFCIVYIQIMRAYTISATRYTKLILS